MDSILTFWNWKIKPKSSHRKKTSIIQRTHSINRRLLNATPAFRYQSTHIILRPLETSWLLGNTGLILVNAPFFAPNEDILHVLTCQHQSANEKRESLLQELKVWLQSANTAPDITSSLISGIRSWFRDPFGDDEPLHNTSDEATFTALSIQLDIGWFALFCGYVTKPVITCQHEFYQSIGSRKHGTSWGRQLSSELWNLTRAIWMHRNLALHETSSIHELSGLENLHLAITAEYNLGLGFLPMPYSPFFYSTLPSFLT